MFSGKSNCYIMGEKIALIGLTGKKSGGAFAKRIIRHIDEIQAMFPAGIRIIVRKKSDVSNLQELFPCAELCYMDESGEICFDELLAGVDTVVNIAGIGLSQAIAAAAVKNKVRRLILIHTTGIYSKYKAAGEKYRQIDQFVTEICENHGIVLTICRPTMIYGNVYDGNVVKFIKLVDSFAITPVVSGARFKLQPVHYEDLADAYFSVLMNEEKTANKNYVLSGGQEIYLRDLLTVIGKELGKQVKFISCPFAIAYAGAWAFYLCTLRKKDYREKVQRLCEHRVYSCSEATAAFGYDPRTFEEGVVEEVNQYLAMKKR